MTDTGELQSGASRCLRIAFEPAAAIDVVRGITDTGFGVSGGTMSKLVGVIASLLLAASIAGRRRGHAGVQAAPPVPMYDWNGFYAGASFAYHSGRTHDAPSPAVTSFIRSRQDTFHGSFGSIEAGYCRMAATPVVRCGGRINLGRARRPLRLHHVGAEHPISAPTQTIDWLVTAGPKLGLAIDANQLFIYASGGGADQLSWEQDPPPTIVGAIGSGSASGTQGWLVRGARHGAAATPSVGVKFDYERVEFHGLDHTLTGGAAG